MYVILLSKVRIHFLLVIVWQLFLSNWYIVMYEGLIGTKLIIHILLFSLLLMITPGVHWLFSCPINLKFALCYNNFSCMSKHNLKKRFKLLGQTMVQSSLIKNLPHFSIVKTYFIRVLVLKHPNRMGGWKKTQTPSFCCLTHLLFCCQNIKISVKSSYSSVGRLSSYYNLYH